MIQREPETLFKLSLETQRLIELLRKTKVDGKKSISYKELSDCCHKDVQHDGRGNLTKARETIRREDQILWETVATVGLQIVEGSEVLGVGTDALKRIRNTARRGTQKLACVEYATLNREEQIKHNAMAAMLGVVGQMSKTKSVERLENAQKDEPKALSIGETLKLFS